MSTKLQLHVKHFGLEVEIHVVVDDAILWPSPTANCPLTLTYLKMWVSKYGLGLQKCFLPIYFRNQIIYIYYKNMYLSGINVKRFLYDYLQ